MKEPVLTSDKAHIEPKYSLYHVMIKPVSEVGTDRFAAQETNTYINRQSQARKYRIFGTLHYIPPQTVTF